MGTTICGAPSASYMEGSYYLLSYVYKLPSETRGAPRYVGASTGLDMKQALEQMSLY